MDILHSVLTALAPYLVELLVAAFFALGVHLARTLDRKFGFEAEAAWRGIEAMHRATISSAIASGLASALARGLTGEAALDHVIRHVTGAGAGDAVGALKLDHATLGTLIRARQAREDF